MRSLIFILLMGFVSASQAFVLGPTNPGKWGSPVMGTGATITWSLMPSGAGTDNGLSSSLASFMPSGFKAQLERAFDAWSDVADLTFIEVADTGENFNTPGGSGDIRIGGHAFDGAGGTLAHGFFPPVNGGTAAGDIHFDTGDLWKTSFGGPGFDIFQVFAHELGHALGLGHTNVPDSLMNPFYTESLSGPQADDIAGMQFLYGAARNPNPNPIPAPGILALLLVGLMFKFSLVKKAKFI